MKISVILSLTEARKNPELNPKVSINAALKAYAEKYGKANSYVSFTELNKLGINPRSTGVYGDDDPMTPIGIYAYPLAYVLRKIGTDLQPTNTLPYAGGQPHATAFTFPADHLINLSTISTTEVELIKNELRAYIKRNHLGALAEFDKVVGSLKPAAKPGRTLWKLIMTVAQDVTGTRDPEDGLPSAIEWTKLFRNLGIEGVLDPGNGIVHPNEKTQAVFFGRSLFGNEQQILNKYNPTTTALSIGYGEAVEQLIASGATGAELADKMGELRSQYVRSGNESPSTSERVMRLIGVDALAARPKTLVAYNKHSYSPIWQEACIRALMSPTDPNLYESCQLGLILVRALPARTPGLDELVLADDRGSRKLSVLRESYLNKFFHHKRWPALERVLLQRQVAGGQRSDYGLIDYAREQIRDRWIEAEPFIAASGTHAVTRYVRQLQANDVAVTATDVTG